MLISKPPVSLCHGARGFTLIELLVVLTILSFMAIMVAPNLSKRPAGLVRNEERAKLIMAIDKARVDAWTSGVQQIIEPQTVVTGTHWVGDRGFPGTSQSALIIYPDGSATPGRIVNGATGLVAINWLTGEAKSL